MITFRLKKLWRNILARIQDVLYPISLLARSSISASVLSGAV